GYNPVTGAYGSFNATLFAVLARHVAGLPIPPNTVAFVRAAQEAGGGWNFAGDPTGSYADVDTTGYALQALVAAGATGSDPDVLEGLRFLAIGHQSGSGAWQSFGSDDPNSTAMAMLGITAAGFDPNASCWRDVVAPSLAGDPYAKPSDWLRTRQLPSGRVQSPNDGFGINTFATSQAVEAWRRGWIPVTPIAPQTCP
ncbi:MAG: terpene cyclase/mutase family protein, partial [Firmicutes bacterium]|nr:terpene cyclase/mutase family protein [Bacillota bacterium]